MLHKTSDQYSLGVYVMEEGKTEIPSLDKEIKRWDD